MSDLDVGAAAARLLERFGGWPGETPTVAVVLGSGLGDLAEGLEGAVSVPMTDLPGLPATSVAGHRGRFVLGRLENVPVLLQAGRFHAYEGHDASIVAAPVRIMAALGIRAVIFTGAVGGIRPGIDPGDIVLLQDLLNLTFRSPLVGREQEGAGGSATRFADMSAPFDAELAGLAAEVADELGIPLGRGVYAGVLGPAYETAAEIRMIAGFGGDVVGMSTAPEVIAAVACGLRVVGLSVVTNRATGLAGARLAHDDVLEAGREAGVHMDRLVRRLVPVASSLVQSKGTK